MKLFSRIYKIFVIFFFKFFYGKINFRRSRSKEIIVEKVNVKNNLYKIFKIKNCRIYTNTNDVAYIKNNLIISGPSIQMRNGINQNVQQNVVIKKGTPKFYKKINARVFSLLCNPDANNNYFHWFFDCLPRLLLFKKNFKFKKNDFFLVPSLKHDYQKKSLSILNIKNLLDAYTLKHIKVNELISVCFESTSNPPYWLVSDLKKNFKLKKTYLLKKISKKKYLKLFINREGINSTIRDAANKSELLNYLKNNNFLIIDPSKLNFLDEIKLFNLSKIVIGMYGAGLTNVIFCKNNSHVIELKNSQTDNLYKNIIKKSKLNYHSSISKRINSNNSTRSWDGSINVDIGKISRVLSKINY